MSGWNQAILQSRKLHQRTSWTDRGCALQAASATSECVTLLFWAQVTKESLKGDPTIRWGDKSYTLIVYSDGTFGSNCDVSFFTPCKGGLTHIISTFLGEITSCLFGSMRLMTPWCWWPCAGMWTRKSRAREANGRSSPLWSSLLLKVKTSANDVLVFLRDQTWSESCRLPRSWCLLWMKKSGETSAVPKNNTMRRWVRPVKKKQTQKKVASGAAGLTAVCSPGTGPADFVLRLHGFRKSCHQTEKAASGHVCPTGVAAGIL